MNWLIELTLRGSLMFAVVAGLDSLFARRVSTRGRRVWWLLVPLAFLLTIRLPILPAATIPTRWMEASLVVAPPANHAGQAATVHPETEGPIRPANIPWLLLLLGGGSAAYLLVVAVRTRMVVRRWRGERLCTSAELLELLEDCKREAGVTVPIGLVTSDTVAGPVILGWLRPRILLPKELTASFSPDQLRGVLFHELSHFRTLDVPCNWLFTLVCALHWFNPVAHLAFRRWTQFCEEAADEATITQLGGASSTAYGDTLLRVIRQAGSHSAPFTALSVAESTHHLRKRLHMIKAYSHKMPRPVLTTAVSLLIAAGALLRPIHAADAPWGEVIDPDKDCRVVFGDGKLEISIPGKDHALSAEARRMNAPRVLQEVTGDFTVQVRVSGDYPTKAASVSPEFGPWQGAGLLLWQDAGNYIRLERAQLSSDTQSASYVVFERRKNGQAMGYSDAREYPLKDGATFLKLERRGYLIFAAFSADGNEWTALEPMGLKAPQALRVGVSASQDTSTPLNVELAGYKLTPAAGTQAKEPANGKSPSDAAPRTEPAK